MIDDNSLRLLAFHLLSFFFITLYYYYYFWFAVCVLLCLAIDVNRWVKLKFTTQSIAVRKHTTGRQEYTQTQQQSHSSPNERGKWWRMHPCWRHPCWRHLCCRSVGVFICPSVVVVVLMNMPRFSLANRRSWAQLALFYTTTGETFLILQAKKIISSWTTTTHTIMQKKIFIIRREKNTILIRLLYHQW